MDTLADISFGGVAFSGDLLSPGLTSDPMFTELFDHQLLLPRSLPSPTPPAPPPPLFVFASVPSLDEWHVAAEAAAAAGGGGGVSDDYGVRAALELSQPSPCSDAGYASLHGSPARPCAPDTPPAAAPALSAVLDSPLVILPNTAVTHSSCGDHQLLRERLRDTSLQQRLNRPSFNLSQLLKPTGGDSDNRLTLSTVETVELHQQQQQLQLPQQQLQQQPQQLQQQLPRTPTSTSWMMEQLGEVFDMALEQVHRENVDTCRSLGIAPDPVRWSADQVRVWLTFTCGQFGLDLDTTSVDTWSLDGAALCSLSEDQLRCWLPQETADVVYAQLSVWLSSKLPSHTSATSTSVTSTPVTSAAATTSTCSVSSVDHVKTEPQTPPPPPPPPSFPSMPVTLPVSLSNGDVDSEDEEMETRCGDTSGSGSGAAAAAAGSGGAARTGSNHIHLWQFLKELLLLTDSDNHNNNSGSRSSNSPHHQLSAEEQQQQQQSGCVRWLDRSRGVFKIEDSVQVARLWGRRKRRPAMNYDKLSRSIRQYYKKGIMKKTERSQRLVYQFCHPYHL